MKQIHTREQLIDVLQHIIWSYHSYDDLDYKACATEIADLIADLPNTCFHETSISTGEEN